MNTLKRKIPFIAVVCLFLLAFVAVHGVNAVTASVAGLGCIALLGTVGAVLPEAEFQKKVLDGVAAQKTQADQLVADYARLEKDTKKVFDDITALKKTANDSANDQQMLIRKFGELEFRLRNEVRAAFGDPVQRIANDQTLKARMNAAVRMALGGTERDFHGAARKFIERAENKELLQRFDQRELTTRAIGEDTSPGSTLIDDKLAKEIYDTLGQFGVWNTFAVRNMGTKLEKYPVKTARPVANYILTEGSPIGDDTAKAGTSVNLTAQVVGVLLNVSIQLLQDAEFDVTADVLDDFAQATAERMDFGALNGTGAANATSGGMTGIFGGGGTASVATTGRVTVEQTTVDDWIRCLLTVDASVLSRQARWWMHPQILVRALSIKDSNGRSIFLTANEAPTPAGIGSILGYPVTLAHAAPATNSANAKVAGFGDPNGQVVGIRSDFAFEASDHARWTTFERSFRGISRSGNRVRRASSFSILTLPAS